MNTFSGINISNALLFDALGKSTLLLVMAFGLALVLRRAPAAHRNLLWRLTFGALVYTTFVSLFLPALHSIGFSAVPTDIPLNTLTRQHQMTVNMPAFWNIASPGWQSRPVAPSFNDNIPQAFPLGLMFKPRIVVPKTGNGFATGNAINGFATRNAMGLAQERAAWLLGGVWLAGFGVALVRFARRGYAARILGRHSLPLDAPAVQDTLAHVGQRLGLTRLPTLRTQLPSSGLFSPLTWGHGQTYVLLPHDAPDWTQERLEAVLLHELAHIRRGDWIAQRLCELVCALVWFHPLAWLAARQMRDSAEQACDDIALTHGIAPTTYARELLAIARALHTPRLPSGAALPFARSLRLESRLKAVLNHNARRHAPSARNARRFALITALLLLPLALLFPVTTHSLLLTPGAKPADVDANITVADGHKVTLPDGTIVELTGSHRETMDFRSNETPAQLQRPPRPGQYRLILNDDFSLRITTRSNTPFSANAKVLGDGIIPEPIWGASSSIGERPPDHRYPVHFTNPMKDTVDGTFLPGTKSCTLRYGVATGEWADAAIYDMRRKTTRVLVSGKSVTFTTLLQRDITKKEWLWAWCETKDTLGKAAKRLVAITRDNKTIVIGTYDSKFDEGGAIFSIELTDVAKLPPIREYRLQTRPYQWAEFRDVQMQPNWSEETTTGTSHTTK